MNNFHVKLPKFLQTRKHLSCFFLKIVQIKRQKMLYNIKRVPTSFVRTLFVCKKLVWFVVSLFVLEDYLIKPLLPLTIAIPFCILLEQWCSQTSHVNFAKFSWELQTLHVMLLNTPRCVCNHTTLKCQSHHVVFVI